MDVKEAVQAAKGYVADVFAQEQVADLGPEEVEFDEARGAWLVTLGLSRPWDQAQSPLARLAGDPALRRSCKVVTIAHQSGKVLSVKNWTEH